MRLYRAVKRYGEDLKDYMPRGKHRIAMEQAKPKVKLRSRPTKEELAQHEATSIWWK